MVGQTGRLLMNTRRQPPVRLVGLTEIRSLLCSSDYGYRLVLALELGVNDRNGSADHADLNHRGALAQKDVCRSAMYALCDRLRTGVAVAVNEAAFQ